MTAPTATPGAIASGQVAEIRARAEKATPGPWQTRFIYRTFQRVRESPGDLCFHVGPEHDWPDADFIAHARTDVVTLLDRVAALEAAVTSFRDLTDDYHACETPDANEFAERVRVARKALFDMVQP